MIQREFVTTSSTNASYVHRKLHPAVVPRWALEKFGVEAYGGVLGRREKSVGEMMLETDGHGNTVKALMLCGDRQVSLNVPLSDKQLAIVARREAEANKIPENVSKILQWAKEVCASKHFGCHCSVYDAKPRVDDDAGPLTGRRAPS